MEWFRAAVLWFVLWLKGFFVVPDPLPLDPTFPDDLTPTAVRETQRALDWSQRQLNQSAAEYNDARRTRIAAQDAEQSRKRDFGEALADRNQKLTDHAAAIRQSYPDPLILDDTPSPA